MASPFTILQAAQAAPVLQVPTEETVTSWLRLLLAPEMCREPAEFFFERRYIHQYRQKVPQYSLAATSWPLYASQHWDAIAPLVRELFTAPRSFNFVQWMMEYARMMFPSIYGSEASTNDDILDLTDALCDGLVSPLHVAAAFGLESIALELISKSSNTSASGFFGCPLLCALAGPKVFSRDFDASTSGLGIAGQKGRRAIISSLLAADAKGQKPYVKMQKHGSALIALGFNVSIASGDRSIIQRIIRGGVDIGLLHEFLREDRLAALPVQHLEHLPSVLSGILDLVLVSSTLELDDDDRQDTIGCLADTFHVMLAAHTRENLDLTDAEFEEALQDAMVEDNVLCFSRLIHDARFDANSPSRTTTSSGTLVHSAVCDNLIDITDMMIDAGGNLDARDDKGRTPLLVSNSRDMLSVLVHQHMAATTAVDHDGRNIWHYVAATADLPLLMWLAAQDTLKDENLRAKNKQGYTPLDEAFRYGLNSIETNDNRTDLGTQNTALAIQLLLVNGAEFSKTINGMPVTHVASIWGLPKIVQTLALHGADFEVIDSHGRSALHYITLLASAEHVRVLQQLCGNAPITDNDGSTPAETIFLSTEVLDASGRVKDHAYPFVFSAAVYDRLLKPQVLSSRDRQGRTLWERFCAKVVPLTYRGDSSDQAHTLQGKWNAAIYEALRILRQHGACRDYEEATGQPAIAALELGIRPHNCAWLFSDGIFQNVIDHSDPKLLGSFFASPAAHRFLVEALLLRSGAAANLLIKKRVPVHVPEEKLNCMTAFEYAIDNKINDVIDVCVVNSEPSAFNARVEEICHVLQRHLVLAGPLLIALISHGFAPQLSVPGSRDETALLAVVRRVLSFDPHSSIVKDIERKGLHVESMGHGATATEDSSSASNAPSGSATDTSTSTQGNNSQAERITSTLRIVFSRPRPGTPNRARQTPNRHTPPSRGSASPANIYERLPDMEARRRRHMALGRSPLHIAVVNRNAEIVRHLLNAGAQDRPDNEGRTARAIANDEGFYDIIVVFEENDATLQRAAAARAAAEE